MILDVNSPLDGDSINRDDPSSSYNLNYLERIFSVVEAFKDYPNTAAFLSLNEVINDVSTGSNNPPYIRAVIRDLKQYIRAHSSRSIPVGYAAADVRPVLRDTWEYLQCDNSANDGNDDSRTDFFGLNSYSWCGTDATFESSTFADLVTLFSNSTVPVFFTEYGCNDPYPRPFDEVTTVHGPKMTVMSGGLVYQWHQDEINYGLVQPYANGSLQILEDYGTLASKYAQLDYDLLTTANETATNLTPPVCSSDLITSDGFNNDFDLPAQPDGASSLISAGVSGISTGSVVIVTQTSVQAPVYATNGARITDLTIRAVSSANAADGDGLATGAVPTSTSGAGASQSSEGGGAETTETSGSEGGSGGDNGADDEGGASESTSTDGAFRAARTGMPLVVAVGAGLFAL